MPIFTNTSISLNEKVQDLFQTAEMTVRVPWLQLVRFLVVKSPLDGAMMDPDDQV